MENSFGFNDLALVGAIAGLVPSLPCPLLLLVQTFVWNS